MRNKKFNGEEVVFYKLKIRSKTANVPEVDGEKCEGGVKTLGSRSEEQSDLRTFMVPSSQGDSEAGVVVAIFNSNFE